MSKANHVQKSLSHKLILGHLLNSLTQNLSISISNTNFLHVVLYLSLDFLIVLIIPRHKNYVKRDLGTTDYLLQEMS